MPLASSSALAAHFTAHELGADQPEATDRIVGNLYTVAQWLEAARAVVGVPIRVTSGFRTVQHNADIGGSPTSDHVVGLAADFEPVGLTPYQSYQRLSAAHDRGTLPPFDQLIFYAADDHVHVGLGSHPVMRGQVLLSTTEGSYVALTGELVTRLRGYV